MLTSLSRQRRDPRALRLLAACILTALLLALCPPPSASAASSASWSNIVQLLTGERYTLGLRSDGRVAWAGDNNSAAIQALSGWSDIQRLERQGWYEYIVGYRRDGSIALTNLYGSSGNAWDHPWEQAELSSLRNVEQLLIEGDLCVALHWDGSVTALTKDAETFGAAVREAASWRDIRQIGVNYDLIVGLKSDGSIVATDRSRLVEEGAYWGGSWSDPSNWTGVQELVDSFIGLYAIKTDGTVIGTQMPGWTNMDSLYFASDSMFGLRRDGTVASNFSVYSREDQRLLEVARWRDIVALGFDDSGWGRYVPLGLCSDGTVKAVTRGYDGTEPYGCWDVSGWTRVKTLYSGSNYTFGLRADGTVLATGGEFGTLPWLQEVAGWRDIAAISVGLGESPHVVGLRFDGSVIACGSNEYGQCNFILA